MIPPLSVADIARQAAEYDYDPTVKLQYWLRTALSLTKEAAIYEREGNDQQAYLLLFRHAQLVLVNLIRHPQAREPENRRPLAEAQREVQNSLKILEVLKPRINKRYERYVQSLQDRNVASQLDSGAPTVGRTPEVLDPAIAGRPKPIAAAENKELAVKLAQKELRRRAAAKLGHYFLNEGYQTQKTHENSFVPDHDGAGDDLARRLQEIRARVGTDNSYIGASNVPPQAQNERPASSRRSGLNDPITYKYPAVPEQSAFSITETVPPIPQKRLLEPVAVRPPARPAKIIESIQEPSAPPIPEKISPGPPNSLSPESTHQKNAPSPSSDLQPSTFTFKPSSYLENGTPLRTIFISPDLRTQFLKVARSNTLKNLETCGILCGSLISNAFFISKLLIPEQESTPDTCEMINEAAVFEYCDREDLMVLGWIHTHPTQTCFMSSRDLHTQSGYQVMLAESIAIVCAPSKMPDWGVFRLTDPPGLKTVLACTQKGLFHPHGEMDIYTDALRPGHVFEAKGLEFETVDLRNR
ncbi:hypothetical protein LOZ12_002331 [Ophidiomyces ophidiicola]|uniref:Uncharacterized protein n=1 Tax=Ophidiomyces ophidiicola TaxID=1387563 RepID=A0ACB8UQB4_9EURO|nr:hypothetical protein LOZ62_006042 [Ophidiomyces ophidiicola]KAI1962600.1 hypothetical protein LOZ56_006590 [Ophidiomyces ophidiicola]KAI2005911.1 hypothetical protein LOZ50_003447 [Ophidiomyces ophidiicola]KAI2026619.1 hypothetical protein LOZ48_005051 [Ophidiomyces ophidiicola]KAI2029988.1 hypothetical protein LOZ47_006633 [Ophidiomyces ophidiicola]